MLLILLMLASDQVDLLVTSANLGREAVVRQLLDEGVPVDARDRNGDTALTAAAGSRAPAVVRLLLDRGADPDLPGRAGRTALSEAAWDAELDTMKMLLEAGADVNRGEDMQPIYTAVLSGNAEAVRLLLEAGAHPEPPGWELPLVRAASSDFPEAVALLLEAGADPRRPDRDGVTPLEWAARQGYAGPVRLLMAVDPEVDGAFQRAALARHAEVVALLLPRVRDLDRALVAACQGGQVEAAADLLARGASPDARDADGLSALVAAARSGPARFGWLFDGSEEPPPDRAGPLLESLLAHGAKVDPAAAVAAAGMGHRGAVEMLLDRGVPVDTRDPQGATLMMLAAQAGNVDLVAALLRRGADRRARDANGLGALDRMARYLERMRDRIRGKERSRAWHPEVVPMREAAGAYRALMDEVARLLGEEVPPLRPNWWDRGESPGKPEARAPKERRDGA